MVERRRGRIQEPEYEGLRHREAAYGRAQQNSENQDEPMTEEDGSQSRYGSSCSSEARMIAMQISIFSKMIAYNQLAKPKQRVYSRTMSHATLAKRKLLRNTPYQIHCDG